MRTLSFPLPREAGREHNDMTRIEIPIPFPIKSVNIYLIEDSAPTLIDAGFHSEEGLEMLKNALREKGLRISDIRRVLLTHGHIDHVGLAGRIQEASGAEIFIHPRDREKCIWDIDTYAEKKKAPFLRFFEESGLPEAVVETIAEEMDDRFRSYFPGDFDVKELREETPFLFDDFTLEVIPCPGHTRGSVCFLDRENRRFFSGDHLLEKITSNPVVELETRENGTGFKSLSHYLESLNCTQRLDIESVLPGHGRPFREHQRRITEIKRHHEIRRDQILKLLRSRSAPPNGLSLFAITMSVFPELKAWDVFLGMSETVGHLEILEQKGSVVSRFEGRQRIYRPKTASSVEKEAACPTR